MSADLRELFEKRVSEKRVAEILDLIATVPNRRSEPLPGDPQGPYDYWFDGGACEVQTGVCVYVLADGTVVDVGDPVPALSVSILFTDGRRVRIQQEGWGELG